MTQILRLEGLNKNAGTQEIREFFDDLHIPGGGVYIVGGSLQEAFIAFKTERQSQLAMLRSGRPLKGSTVTLHISNMDEMELKLTSVLKKNKNISELQINSPQPAETPSCADTPSPHYTVNNSPPTAWSVDPHAANMPPLKSDAQIDHSILGVCSSLQDQQSPNPISENELVKTTTRSSNPDDKEDSHEQNVHKEKYYVRLFGLPPTTTKEDICHFFCGLTVEEVIVNAKLEHKYGCLVKFASMQDASDSLRFNMQTFGPVRVEVRGATERIWNSVLQECKNNEEQHLFKKRVNYSSARMIKRPIKQPFVKSIKNFKPSRVLINKSSSVVEHVIMVRNLPKTMTKTDLKELFGCPKIPRKDVLHLLDKERNRTDTAFLIFDSTGDFNYAVNFNGCHVGNAPIEVSSITIEKMREMIAKSHSQKPIHFSKTGKREKTYSPVNEYHTCMLMRNLPGDVQKSEVNGLFNKFMTKEDDITLLYDTNGNGIGEAVVQFKSAKFAARAQTFHNTDFLGANLLLTPLNEDQKKKIILNHTQGL